MSLPPSMTLQHQAQRGGRCPGIRSGHVPVPATTESSAATEPAPSSAVASCKEEMHSFFSAFLRQLEQGQDQVLGGWGIDLRLSLEVPPCVHAQ